LREFRGHESSGDTILNFSELGMVSPELRVHDFSELGVVSPELHGCPQEWSSDARSELRQQLASTSGRFTVDHLEIQ